MPELPYVLWIGGPAGAGKTTVARRLARRHGLRWYNADAHTWEHRDRALAAGVTLPDRGPGAHLYDRRPMIVDDLRALPDSPLVLAEGGQLTPDMAGLFRGAVWLMPSHETQRVRLENRHPNGVPPAYLDGYNTVVGQLEDTGVATISVDGLTVEQSVAEVKQVFASHLKEGPRAETRQGRQSLLRYANQAIVNQCLSPSTKPLAGPVVPDKLVRTFDCECGIPTCEAFVDLIVLDAQAAIASPPPTITAECL